MRQFLVVGHDAPTTPDFPLDDLAGAAGRLDVLCRCVTAGLLLSHGVREDVRVHLVLDDALTVRFDGSAVRRLNPDERSTAARVRTALERRDEAVGRVPAEPSPGVELYRMGFAETLEALAADATVVHLDADGRPVVDADPPADPLFVLSDHRDFATDERDTLDATADERLRLGPRALHADQAVTVAHNYLDTDGYARY
ncbi:MAG: tRNA (pseudouridine(54)-N(1))-methyltransferase TrmY [Haloferacaceae archaeon]